jgi:hypothetical protein
VESIETVIVGGTRAELVHFHPPHWTIHLPRVMTDMTLMVARARNAACLARFDESNFREGLGGGGRHVVMIPPPGHKGS